MLPLRYQWLAIEREPRMIVEAVKLFGTLEGPGGANNPVILSWATEVGGDVRDVYKADSIPWCGLFMAVVAKRSDKVLPTHPLWALSWSAFGQPVDVPMLGDVLTFTRNGGGHVALYVGEDEECFHILGGNQSDRVWINRKPKNQLYAARRPAYRVQPPNVRRILLDKVGALSTKED
jgi:uncharacterized protein (TIGR02594 family)